MEYNFDEIIERKGTDTYKYAHIQKVCGREDVLPMWVADMDFKTPPFGCSNYLSSRIVSN